MILVVSASHDAHLPRVLEALRRRGARATVFDLASLPGRASVTFAGGVGPAGEASLRVAGARLRLEEVEAVWWRRPRPYQLPQELSGPHADFAFTQLHAAMAGLWSALHARWVNEPWADHRADQKVGHPPALRPGRRRAGHRRRRRALRGGDRRQGDRLPL